MESATVPLLIEASSVSPTAWGSGWGPLPRLWGTYGALDKRLSHQAFNLVGRVQLPDASPAAHSGNRIAAIARRMGPYPCSSSIDRQSEYGTRTMLLRVATFQGVRSAGEVERESIRHISPSAVLTPTFLRGNSGGGLHMQERRRKSRFLHQRDREFTTFFRPVNKRNRKCAGAAMVPNMGS